MLWSAFYPDLVPAVPGCPDPMLEKQTRFAAIEFLRRTRAWVEWLDPATSIAGLSEYDFDLPAGADVARVERATLDGIAVQILSFHDAPHDWTRKDMADQGLVSRDRKTFRLGNAVAASLLIQVQAALVPSRLAPGLPDDLFERYNTEISAGALSKLLAIPGTPFYAPDLALFKKSEFNAAIDTIAVDAWRGHTANTPRSRVSFC